jgi:hypothetical protein
MNDHLSAAYCFKGVPYEWWHPLIYLYHRVSHPQYNVNPYAEGELNQLTLG